MLIAKHQLPASMIPVGGFYAAIGSVLGASITYWVARMGGRPLVDKFARWVHIKPTQISHAEQLFHRWGAGLVLAGRVIPGIRTLVSIPAGLARMNFPIFMAATFIGAYIWCTLLIGAGYLLGHEWPLISSYVKQAFPFFLATGVITMIVYILLTRRSRTVAFQKPQDAD
jgi:membrane protein DedA with SNARE-associated domain